MISCPDQPALAMITSVIKFYYIYIYTYIYRMYNIPGRYEYRARISDIDNTNTIVLIKNRIYYPFWYIITIVPAGIKK